MHRAVSTTMTLALLAALLSGCQHTPAATYEPRLTMASLAPGLDAPDNTYLLQVDDQTQGRFPCSLAVARLALPEIEPNGDLVTAEMSPGDEAYWTEAFRGVSAIRDLRFLDRRSLKDDGGGISGLLAAARRIEAPLLLVHAPNRYGPNSAQVLGVLYDVETKGPIAALHTSAHRLNEDGLETAPEEEKGDRRLYDACYQAGRAFEHQAVDCLRDQFRRDELPHEPQPHHWTPLYPFCTPMVPMTQPAWPLPDGRGSDPQSAAPLPPRPNAPIRAAATLPDSIP